MLVDTKFWDKQEDFQRINSSRSDCSNENLNTKFEVSSSYNQRY